MSPVFHCGLALIGWQASAQKKNYITLMAYVLLSNLPDFDFLIYALNSKILHQYYTHNIFFALISALLFFPFFKTIKERVVLIFLAISHLIADLFLIDTFPPIGLQLFFPFSNKLFNIGFFPTLNRSNIYSLLFDPVNYRIYLLELAILLPLALWVFHKNNYPNFIHKRFWTINYD
jgi:hypothetical protein